MNFKQLLFVLFFSLMLCVPAVSYGQQFENSPLFIEMWNSLAYYDTNLERTRFASALGRFEGKIGFNFFNYPLQFYAVYYGVASQDSEYWNNSIFSGGGVRIMPFQGLRAPGILADVVRAVKIYGEGLSSTYLNGKASAEAAGLAEEDRRYGIEIYREWNLDDPDENSPWGELWGKLDWRETNFGWEEFKDYVLYFQPKLGRHLGDGIEVYLRADVTASGKEGPDYSFLNVADYGAGIRFEPWRKIGKTDDLLRKFKMFAEFLGVSYLKDKPTDPDRRVDSDLRFGIEFSYGR